MIYRQHRGFNLSEIGIGCYGLSGAYGHADVEIYKTTLQRAYELGINFFDTADAYGDAETILGQVIKPFRDQIYLATKVGVTQDVKPLLSAEYIQQACESSLRNLGTDWIDLYQVHFDDRETPTEETVAALENLINQGKIRRYGLGHISLERMEEYIHAGNVFSVMTELSAANRAAREDIIPLCTKHQTAVLAFSVTGRGLLTGAIDTDTRFDPGDIRNLDPLFQPPTVQSGLRVMEKLNQIARRYARTTAQMAINWALAQNGVTCALTGPSQISHLEENVAASGWQINQSDLDELEDFFETENLRLVAEQRATINRILTQALNTDPNQAFTDLIYVIENTVALKLISETDVLPIFYELYDLRNNLKSLATQSQMSNIQKRLKDLQSDS